MQIMALLVGGLVVAQLVTLMLTLLLPPAPTPQYGLDDIAAALVNDPDAELGRVIDELTLFSRQSPASSAVIN